MSKNKSVIELEVSKFVEDLKGMEDVLHAPRSWSPDDLRDVCKNMNISFLDEENAPAIEPIEQATVLFLLKEFFYLEHQTGLYNTQKDLWSAIAKTKRITISPYKPLFLGSKEQNPKVSDICFHELATGNFVKTRLVHPKSDALDASLTDMPAPKKAKKVKEPAGFGNLIGNVPKNCVGLFYISQEAFPEELITKVKSKTNSEDFFDRYKSPIGSSNCSLNLIQYFTFGASLEYDFHLIHPNLEREVSSRVSLSY